MVNGNNTFSKISPGRAVPFQDFRLQRAVLFQIVRLRRAKIESIINSLVQCSVLPKSNVILWALMGYNT